MGIHSVVIAAATDETASYRDVVGSWNIGGVGTHYRVVPPETRLPLVGQEAVTADGGETLILTGPDRPERLFRVRVTFPDGAVKETDDAEMLKSRIVTRRVIE